MWIFTQIIFQHFLKKLLFLNTHTLFDNFPWDFAESQYGFHCTWPKYFKFREILKQKEKCLSYTFDEQIIFIPFLFPTIILLDLWFFLCYFVIILCSFYKQSLFRDWRLGGPRWKTGHMFMQLLIASV